MNSKRIHKMRDEFRIDKYPICVEKFRLMTESYRKIEGEPEILIHLPPLTDS